MKQHIKLSSLVYDSNDKDIYIKIFSLFQQGLKRKIEHELDQLQFAIKSNYRLDFDLHAIAELVDAREVPPY